MPIGLVNENLPHNDKIEVPVPAHHSLELNEHVIAEWLWRETDSEIRKIKTKLVGSIRNISFNEFCAVLDKTVERFNNLIGEEPYAVYWDTQSHKSKRWVSTLCEDKLRVKPRFTSYIKNPGEIVKQLEGSSISTIAIFDDAIYTGDQLSDSLYIPLWNYLKEIGYKKTVRLILCVPYVGKGLKSMIDDRWDDEIIKTELITEEEIPALWDILSKHEIDLLMKRDKKLNIATERDDPDSARFQPLYFGSTTVMFEHKTADGTSVCRPLMASVGVDLKLIKEPYKIKNTPYYNLEEKEYGPRWFDHLT